MEYRHEIITYSENVPVKLFVHQLGFAPMHWHNSIELLFVLSGSVRINIGGNIYILKENDIVLVNSNEPHELSSERAILMAVQIKLSLFDNNSFDEKEMHFHIAPDIDPGHPGLIRLKRIIARFIKNYSSAGQERILRAKSLSYALLAELVESFHVKEESDRVRDENYYARIASIITYINDHFREHLSLQMLAENEFLSISYLSRFFKKMMGMNFLDYLNQIRLNHAVNDLLKTNMTIEQISESNGFPNLQIFTQRFRKQYHTTPGLYRKQNRNNVPASILPKSESFNEYIILNTHHYLDYFAAYLSDDLSGESEEHTVSENPVTEVLVKTGIDGKPVQHLWRQFTSAGSARDLLVKDIQEMLRVHMHFKCFIQPELPQPELPQPEQVLLLPELLLQMHCRKLLSSAQINAYPDNF